MCDGHAVVCMRDPEIFVWGGGGCGEPASTEKGLYFLYIVSRGKVRTSVPMETYSTCDFRGGERVRSLTDFTRGGGVVPLLVVGSYQYSIPMKSYSTCDFSGGGGVFSLNPPMICTPVMM